MHFLSVLLNISITVSLWLYLLRRGGAGSIFSPLFWYLAFHTIVFLLRPMAAEWQGYWIAYDYMGFTPDSSDLASAHFAVTLALLSFALFHEVGFRYSDGTRRNIQLATSQKLTWRGVGIAWLVFGPVAIYSAVFVGGAAFGSGTIEMDRVNGVAINVNQNGYLLDAQFTLIGLCTLLVFKADFRLWSFTPVLLFFAYRSLMGWGRWSIVLCALALGLIWIYRQGKLWPSPRVLLYALPLLILFSVLGNDREAIKNLITGVASEKSSGELKSDPLRGIFDGLDFANFDYLVYVMKHVPASTGTYTFGVQHLQVFTEPIPRALWSGKPAGAPIQLFNLNDYGNFIGLTPSLVGDGWMSAGYIGIFISMALLSFPLAIIYRKLVDGRLSGSGLLLYMCFISLLVQIFRDGSLVTLVKFSALVLMPILLARVLSRSELGTLSVSQS